MMFEFRSGGKVIDEAILLDPHGPCREADNRVFKIIQGVVASCLGVPPVLGTMVSNSSRGDI
jgi:hypothetical protein